MVTIMRNFRNIFTGGRHREAQQIQVAEALDIIQDRTRRTPGPSIEIAPDDPIISYFLDAPGVVEIDKLNMDSPALRAMKAAGVRITVPLVNQGELVGLLNLGSRLSEQEYSADDYRLLSNLATQASPALRVAQLVRQQQAEVQERERLEQELRVARIIQQTLLPKDVPALPGWQVAAYWQPARAVGGDFYDFIHLQDGRLGLVIADVTDKGVPAALVMATTRSILRDAAERYSSPGPVLERANNLLCGDIPRNMFVTCQYMILDPDSGRMQYANAGHNLPFHRTEGGVLELRATGMPLGLMSEMKYEERETCLAPGDSILFYSDGLVEAHDAQRDMFSFQRLHDLLVDHVGGASLIEFLLDNLRSFTGPEWEQEDDVTMMILKREEGPTRSSTNNDLSEMSAKDKAWHTLTSFELPSNQGNERQAMEKVAESVQNLNLPEMRVERLKTAVAEATMNAIEHGNHFRADLPVSIQVLTSENMLKIVITDRGGGVPIPEAKHPDLDAKLAGLQSPRGWGLFLIKNMVDDMNVISDDTHHTVELFFNLKGITQ
jgi:serine phosphatase RsbU (regulator of sigma subunit)/anti-sigma regulatory factor (Ser/Thr protein kinase)